MGVGEDCFGAEVKLAVQGRRPEVRSRGGLQPGGVPGTAAAGGGVVLRGGLAVLILWVLF